ncbi:meiotic recombination protein W68 [Phymastichus coffea]|uniref:meiotic recombination protein W68 n=1 Tax=Phymastichus coffea TaxID=108790 RepID=UPI00273BF8D4|nr:meiotic recombination protein W68 [Phymastichus coffea]
MEADNQMNVDTPDDKVYEVSQANVFERRQQIISRIEDVLSDLIIAISRNETPSLVYADGKSSGWSSNSSESMGSTGSDGMGDRSESSEDSVGHVKMLKFSGNATRKRFAIIMRILEYVHAKLIANVDETSDSFYCTKRAFYYSLKNEPVKRFLDKPEKVYLCIGEVATMLDCAPWEIGFTTTSKGLIAGDLSLYIEDVVKDYAPQSCQAVPDVIPNVTRVRTSAEYVLVVEKDSAFQRLLAEGCPAFNKCIMITAKGYPDIPSRMIVSLLSEKAALPVYALVDADPYGFEIMCVYRFGTSNNSGFREQLLCPKMRWLGIHQRDLTLLGISRIPLKEKDLKKIEDLSNRCYVGVDFSQHLNEMKLGKAEIENVDKPMKHFLSEYYIPTKIQNKSYF